MRKTIFSIALLALCLTGTAGAHGQRNEPRPCVIVEPWSTNDEFGTFLWSLWMINKRFEYVEGDFPKGVKFRDRLTDNDVSKIHKAGGKVVVIPRRYSNLEIEQARKACATGGPDAPGSEESAKSGTKPAAPALTLTDPSGPTAPEDLPLVVIDSAVSPDDPTLRLFQLLDSRSNEKLDDFYVIADVFKDPQNPDHELQHILRVDYDKSRDFGRLRLYLRTVEKLTSEQLKSYSPKQTYEFAESDTAGFFKTDPGPFGKAKDVYFLPASPGGSLVTTPATDEARNAYERYVTTFVLPALQRE